MRVLFGIHRMQLFSRNMKNVTTTRYFVSPISNNMINMRQYSHVASANEVCNFIDAETFIEGAQARLIDCCPDQQQYEQEHIEGSIPLLAPVMLKNPDSNMVKVIEANQIKSITDRLKIATDTEVVLYDDAGSLFAARMWWVLRYYGHHNARVLRGGLKGIVNVSGHKYITDGPAPEIFCTNEDLEEYGGAFEPLAMPKLLATKKEILDTIQAHRKTSHALKHNTQILDVRTLDEFVGSDMKTNQRGGHIPRALHLPYTNLLTSNGEWLPPGKAIQALRSANVDVDNRDRRIITYCQAGVRAAHTALMLSSMGFTNVAVYDGSAREWLNDESTPVTKPSSNADHVDL